MQRIGCLLTAVVLLSACGSAGSNDGSGGGATGTGGSVTVDLDGGGVAATPPDGAAACPAGACNYQTGKGCTGGDSCLPTLSATKTVEPVCVAPGTVAANATCVNTDDCVAGYICSNGTCRKLCCGGDWTGCDSASEHCLVSLDFTTTAGNVSTGAMVCYPVNDCDALKPATCSPSGTTCQIADATGAVACLPNGTGTAGQACPCQGGFACVQEPGASPACVRLCAAVEGGAAPFCEANEGTCTHYTRDPAGVGECLAPSGG